LRLKPTKKGCERLCEQNSQPFWIVARLRKTYGTQPASQMGRFETEILTQPQNPKALMNQPGQWVDVHEIS